MDFSVIFQSRTKKVWWMDVIFYFVISLLIATLFCYVIFLIKNNFQQIDIKKETEALNTVGTALQKEHEAQVIIYKKKIGDFAGLLKNHEFASNVFAFMEQNTMPNIWFNQFNLDEKNSTAQLAGKSDDMDAFSRQVATFEKNKYVKNIGTLNSALGQSANVDFNINLTLDQSIFTYISSASAAPAVVEQFATSQVQITPDAQSVPVNQTTPSSQTTLINQTNPSGSTESNTQINSQLPVQAESSEKSIISFHLVSSPEIVGIINETQHFIVLTIPYGTDVKNLVPIIKISSLATILPASGVVQDFTSPVIYRVTAQDGSIQAYAARVIISPAVEVVVKNTKPVSIILVFIISICSVAVIAIISLLIWKRMRVPKKKF